MKGIILLTWSPRYNMTAEAPEEDKITGFRNQRSCLELINRLEE